MAQDVALVFGLALMVLALPSALAAWSDRRLPLVALFSLGTGAVLMVWGDQTQTSGYGLKGLGQIILRALGGLFP